MSSDRVGRTTFLSSATTWRTNSAMRANKPRRSPLLRVDDGRGVLEVDSSAPEAAAGAESLTVGPYVLVVWCRRTCADRADLTRPAGPSGPEDGSACAGQARLELATAGFGDRCATNCATALRRARRSRP